MSKNVLSNVALGALFEVTVLLLAQCMYSTQFFPHKIVVQIKIHNAIYKLRNVMKYT